MFRNVALALVPTCFACYVTATDLKICEVSSSVQTDSTTAALSTLGGTELSNAKLVINDIFDLEDLNTIFLHNWANILHVKTKPNTITKEAAFLADKCQISDDDLYELERHLRNKRYLRDASVTRNETSEITIETWDNWSLMPTIDFTRKGGKNRTAIGVKEQNLLGLGINAEFEYFANELRTGYKIKSHFPLAISNNTYATLRLTNNDDGTSQALFIDKKYLSFDSENAFTFGFSNFDQIDTRYKNGLAAWQYAHIQHYATGRWSWLLTNSNDTAIRVGLGYTSEHHQFSRIDRERETETVSYAQSLNLLPTERLFNYPFLTVEYFQKDYRKLSNLRLINHVEDFNLGWVFKARIGTDINSGPSALWRSSLTKGVQVFSDAYWLFSLYYAGEIQDNEPLTQFQTNDEISGNTTEDKNRHYLKFGSEYFHKLNNSWAAYVKNTNIFSQNQFLDAPVVLDSETGLRGFPLQYLNGKHSTQLTVEARYYPHLNIYKLIELGGAVFVDAGKTYGRDEQFTASNTPDWLASVGIGARFYSTHSSEAQVIHVDLIRPIASDPNVNNVELRITTRQSF